MTGHDEQTEALVRLVQLPYDQRRERYNRYGEAPQVSFQDIAAAVRAAGWLSPVEVAARERSAAADAIWYASLRTGETDVAIWLRMHSYLHRSGEVVAPPYRVEKIRAEE